MEEKRNKKQGSFLLSRLLYLSPLIAVGIALLTLFFGDGIFRMSEPEKTIDSITVNTNNEGDHIINIIYNGLKQFSVNNGIDRLKRISNASSHYLHLTSYQGESVVVDGMLYKYSGSHVDSFYEWPGERTIFSYYLAGPADTDQDHIETFKQETIGRLPPLRRDELFITAHDVFIKGIITMKMGYTLTVDDIKAEGFHPKGMKWGIGCYKQN